MSNTAGPTTSPTKPSPTANTKPSRLPAPTLFVGPPSRNASQLSITRAVGHDPTLKPSHDPLTRTKSALRPPYHSVHDSKDADAAAAAAASSKHPPDPPPTASANDPVPAPTAAGPPPRRASARRVDAKWRELQNTLNEVELTAQRTTHVFGSSHAAALAALRAAQVELARAWGRGNDAVPTVSGAPSSGAAAAAGVVPPLLSSGNEDLAPDSEHASVSTGGSEDGGGITGGEKKGNGAGGAGTGGAALLEDETAQDVKLASERRAANETYFRKVDRGVKDVVAKLETVAEAMKGLEGETRSLWSTTTTTTSSSGVESEERSLAAAG